MNRHGSLTLLGIALAVLALHLPGVRRDLPYVHESDENQVVERAANVASTGDLNPHWFGAPGSTLIYPLAAIYRVALLTGHVEIDRSAAADESENPVPGGWA